MVDAAQAERLEERRFRRTLAAVLGFGLVVGAIGSVTAPEAFSLAFLVLVLSCVAALSRPVLGVYLVVFLTLVGDSQTTPWWPFTKNMSSKESVFYVSDALSVTPMEVLLVVTVGSFALRGLVQRSMHVRRGRLLLPMAVFALFVLYGLINGIGTGGDRNVAIFEVRPMIYLPILYLLVTNLVTTKQQYRFLFAVAMIAVAIQSIFSLTYYRSLPPEKRAVLETLSEHTATVHMNALFLFFLGLVLFKGSRWKIVAVAVLVPAVAWAYLLSQRRAAMISLVVGGVVVAALLFRHQPRRFWRIAPVTVFLAIVFVLVTWNAQGALGLPATAVKTVLFPDELTENDQASNMYRVLEGYNLWFTIHSEPLRGLGFGQKFLVVVDMPDISFFEEWQYLPHNSVLWVWIKLGFFGFAATLFVLARAVQRGTRAALRTRAPDDVALVTASLCYVIMFVIFGYVDIGWDIRPSVFLALCLAVCCDFEWVPEGRRRVALAPEPATATSRTTTPSMLGATI